MAPVQFQGSKGILGWQYLAVLRRIPDHQQVRPLCENASIPVLEPFKFCLTESEWQGLVEVAHKQEKKNLLATGRSWKIGRQLLALLELDVFSPLFPLNQTINIGRYYKQALYQPLS